MSKYFDSWYGNPRYPSIGYCGQFWQQAEPGMVDSRRLGPELTETVGLAAGPTAAGRGGATPTPTGRGLRQGVEALVRAE